MSDRNTNARFELAPQVAIERSTYNQPCNIKTSFDVGELVPFYCTEILPGDSVQIETAKALRLQTLITPVMDNLYLDTYYFFVPNRLVWQHWEEFCGANKTNAWVPTVEYSVPQIQPPSGGWTTGTIADYLGIPALEHTPSTMETVNALPFRAYAKIVDDWFRDENLQRPIYFSTGDATVTGSNGSNYVNDLALGGKPFVACKFHDYFTSCLPAPQKSAEPVTFLPEYVPITTRNVNRSTLSSTAGLLWRTTGGAVPPISTTTALGITSAGYNVTGSNSISANTTQMQPVNLWTDFSDAGITINDLRQAFQIQRIFEKDARAGTRYVEIIQGHFGVTSPDARLQRSEYLGGNRIPFNIEQVVQTSSTDATTPQGNVSGWSLTNDDSFDVNKSFTEHGYIIGLVCARYDHSYQQGMERHWFRKQRFDYYWPSLAHLGEQAVYDREICWTGDATQNEVFGYQEAWAEYRYKPNYITGQMSSCAAQPLDFWHFGDYYWDDDEEIPRVPVLSEEWIQEDKSNIDRCLAVTSSVSNQIFGDIFVKAKWTRPLPLYSIPGLVDHF